MPPGEDLLLGIVCLGLVAALGWRLRTAFITGTIPVYRTRITRVEAGDTKFFALVGLNAAGMVLLGVIAADLLLGLGLRGR